MLKLTATDSFFIFDDYGMLVVKSDELSWRDSVGRTVLAWIAYGMPYELMNALGKCFALDSNGKFILYRHPNHKEKSSRDHWSYAIIWRMLYDNKFHVNHISTREWLSRIPSMRGMTLWIKSLAGNKRAERRYYFWNIPGALIGNTWLKFCRWWMNFGNRIDEASNEWWINGGNPNQGTQMLYDRTKWQKLWAWIIFQTIPAYPLHNRGWQLYVMPDSKAKERLKRILLKRVGMSNILLRLLFQPYDIPVHLKVTQQEVDRYPFMTGFRPGVYLDETCRRTIRKLTAQESEYNTYEVDLIKWLYGIQMGK